MIYLSFAIFAILHHIWSENGHFLAAFLCGKQFKLFMSFDFTSFAKNILKILIEMDFFIVRFWKRLPVFGMSNCLRYLHFEIFWFMNDF